MGIDIFVGIDGTGVSDDCDYESDFIDSHVNTLYRGWGTRATSYQRGPTNDGMTTGLKASWAHRQVEKARKAHGTDSRVFLCGYSRGAAAVIQAAYSLSISGIKVRGLLLFDAVDRSTVVFNTEKIPSNVEYCAHALRDPDAGSREMFGNCGRKHGGKTRYVEKEFYATHGGVGGTPWKRVGRDGTVNVDKCGNIRELSPDQVENGIKGSVVLAHVLKNPGMIGRGAAEIAKNTVTNVTLTQDKDGSDESLAWMKKQLKMMRTHSTGGSW